MTKEERDLIKSFIENKPLVKAVKSILLQGIYPDANSKALSLHWVFNINPHLDDAEFGRHVKVTAEALRTVEAAFTQMEQIANSSAPKKTVNEAR
ncbi:MAG: hypothetical protein KGZ73_05180 [Rhizobiales bacterium]|nr:hypothetical protein [Hyphomicrobiales bacterium]